MQNLRWADTELSIHFRATNMDPSIHFRKAHTDPSMNFWKANAEFLLSFLLLTLLTISLTTLPLFFSQFKSQQNYQRVIPQKMPCNLCFLHSFLFNSKVASLQFPANGTCRKRLTLQNVCTRRSTIQILTQLSLAKLHRSHGLYTSM